MKHLTIEEEKAGIIVPVVKLGKDAVAAIRAGGAPQATAPGGLASVTNNTLARQLVDLYYDMQETRKRLGNKQRAADHGRDAVTEDTAIDFMLAQSEAMEHNAKGFLEAFVQVQPIYEEWLREVHGIGPILAAGLIAYLGSRDLPPTVGHWWRYAGLDPSQKWLSADELGKLWKIYEGDVETRARAIALEVGRDPNTVMRDATTDFKTGEPKPLTKDSAIKSLARIPYNRRLKTLCVVPGQRVLTRTGYRPIEGVAVGDEVLTHLGRWRKVTEVMRNEYEGEVVDVRAVGRSGLGPTLTADHPVLAKQNNVCYYGEGQRKWRAKRTQPAQRSFERAAQMRALVSSGVPQRTVAQQLGVSESLVSLTVRGERNLSPRVFDVGWARADALRPGWDVYYPRVPHLAESVVVDLAAIGGCVDAGDGRIVAEGRWAGVPAPRGLPIQRYLEIDEVAAYFMGLYLAEGCASRNTVALSFDIREEEYQQAARDFLSGLGLTVYDSQREENNSVQVCATSSLLAAWLRKTLGEGAHDKAIPMEWIERLSDDALRALLTGIFDGDGYLEGTGQMLTTVSEGLAYSAALAIERLGDVASLKKYDAWKVGWRPANSSHVVEMSGTRSYVQSAETRKYSGLVYNLEVEEDHSYVCEGVAVHNCWKISDQWVKLGSNENALYAVYYRNRKAEELRRNVNGDRAGLARATLEKFPHHAQRKTYSEGMLPPGRLDLMARRATEKLFLSHLHAMWWRIEKGTEPPAPFAMTKGHGHYIPPFYS